MQRLFQRRVCLAICALNLFLFPSSRAVAADLLTWQTNRNSVTADVQSVPLTRLLEGVAKLTGWQIYLESNTTFNVSAKFQDLPSGEALRHLLGNLNFALVPQTNARPHFYVFRSSQKNATLLIQPADLNSTTAASRKAIPNELIVRLKPGANIEALARALGAKVVGHLDGWNAYRLQFPDENSTNAARDQLAGNSDVAGVESNFFVDPPPAATKMDSPGMAPVQLKLNPPDSSGRVIVGLVDTAVQPLDNDLDKFLLKALSVAGPGNADPGLPTHGTSMFENILRAAAAQSGGSSSMQVVSVDVYGPNPTTSTFDVASGIPLAINYGANLINLSLGSPGDSPILHDVIKQATQLGIPIFAAAGNDGSTESFYPAAYPEVTAVTAGSKGTPASYANTGSFVDLMAPGSGVVYFGDNAFLVSGTSTATAFVSGTVGGAAGANHISIPNAAKAISIAPAFQFHPVK